MKKSMLIITAVMAMTAAQPVMAGEDAHQMSGHSHMQGDMSQAKEMFLVKKEIDGFTVSFHVMKPKAAMVDGGAHHSAGQTNGTGAVRPQGEGHDALNHNLMVKVEKDGKALTDLTANSKVTHPNGKSESKMLMKMGDWYMAGYDLGHEGTHQLMVLFKTPDGSKHFTGVYYPENEPGADHEQHH